MSFETLVGQNNTQDVGGSFQSWVRGGREPPRLKNITKKTVIYYEKRVFLFVLSDSTMKISLNVQSKYLTITV